MSVRAAQFRDGESYESGSHQARPKECVVRVTTHYPPRGVLQSVPPIEASSLGASWQNWSHLQTSTTSLIGARFCQEELRSNIQADADVDVDPDRRRGGAPLKPAFPFTRLLVHRTSRMETAEMGEERTHRSQPEARDAEEWL
ncbi:hypothetical protein PDE_02825 [Penicillium oxalicum 114-2]|uniref:Uncharacterized protein n=1 Tax=Penicillium oxalicum (strain 114-2 / CGMCC 5302) TaxID=933388 RepID=S7ZGW8_PENO1|nr:hypothetical protein PDE_02825 [Penicillium oxalicum 114-2]